MPIELEMRSSPPELFHVLAYSCDTGSPGGCGENIVMSTPLSLIWMVTRFGARAMRIVAFGTHGKR
jgi:hypothetical protein